MRNCNSVNFCTFSKIKNDILEYMESDDCQPDIKILFGEWLFKKIYMLFKFDDSTKEEICEHLSEAIRKCNIFSLKGNYLSLHDMDALGKLTLSFYYERLGDEWFVIQMLNDVQLVKNYIQNSEISDDELREHFIEWIKNSKVQEQKSNILDILLKYYPNHQQVREIHEEMKFGSSTTKTIYDNEQNVHDDQVLLSTSKAACNLIEWKEKLEKEIDDFSNPEKWTEYAVNKLEQFFPGCSFDKFINKLKREETYSTYKNKNFLPIEVFISFLVYTELSQLKENILSVFYEELGNTKNFETGAKCANMFASIVKKFNSGFTPLDNTKVMYELVKWREKLEKELRSCYLFDDWRTFALNKLKKFFPQSECQPTINCVVDRMSIDNTSFECEEKIFLISDVFTCSVIYIELSDSKEGILPIFYEELCNMKDLCSSGYIARLMNSFQGFDKRFEINISVEDQIYAVLSYKIQLGLEKASEDVIMGTIDESCEQKYVDFLKDIVNRHIHEMVSDYGESDVMLFIVDVITKISGLEGWSLSQDKKIIRE